MTFIIQETSLTASTLTLFLRVKSSCSSIFLHQDFSEQFFFTFRSFYCLNEIILSSQPRSRYVSNHLSLFPCIGNSGMGCYHGKFSFDQLSHMRSCLIKQLNMEGVNSMRYPPHTPKKLGWARFFILNSVDLGWIGRMGLLAILVVVFAYALQVSHTTTCDVLPLCSVYLWEAKPKANSQITLKGIL